jgi:hypothetical protein
MCPCTTMSYLARAPILATSIIFVGVCLALWSAVECLECCGCAFQFPQFSLVTVPSKLHMVVNKCQSQTKPLVRQQAQPDKCVLYYWACQQQQKSPYHRRRAGAALMTAVFATRQVPALRQAQPDTQEARL